MAHVITRMPLVNQFEKSIINKHKVCEAHVTDRVARTLNTSTDWSQHVSRVPAPRSNYWCSERAHCIQIRFSAQGPVRVRPRETQQTPTAPSAPCGMFGRARPREGNSGHGAKIQLLRVIRAVAAGQTKDSGVTGMHWDALRTRPCMLCENAQHTHDGIWWTHEAILLAARHHYIPNPRTSFMRNSGWWVMAQKWMDIQEKRY